MISSLVPPLAQAGRYARESRPKSAFLWKNFGSFLLYDKKTEKLDAPVQHRSLTLCFSLASKSESKNIVWVCVYVCVLVGGEGRFSGLYGIASHADALRGSSRVPAWEAIYGKAPPEKPGEVCATQ